MRSAPRVDRRSVSRIPRLVDRDLRHDGGSQMVGEAGAIERHGPVAKRSNQLPAQRLEIACMAEDPLETLLLAGTMRGPELELAQHDVERVGGDPREKARPPARGRHDLVA